MIDQNIIFCPALYLPTSALYAHCLSILRQCSTATEYLLIRDVVMHKTHKHKHQRDENAMPKNGCKMRPICGVPKVCAAIAASGRRTKSRTAPPGRSNHHGPVTGAINKFGAHNHFRLLMMILLVIVHFLIRANTDEWKINPAKVAIKPAAASGFNRLSTGLPRCRSSDLSADRDTLRLIGVMQHVHNVRTTDPFRL